MVAIFFTLIQISTTFCKKIVKTLIKRVILQRLIWVCIVCQDDRYIWFKRLALFDVLSLSKSFRQHTVLTTKTNIFSFFCTSINFVFRVGCYDKLTKHNTDTIFHLIFFRNRQKKRNNKLRMNSPLEQHWTRLLARIDGCRNTEYTRFRFLSHRRAVKAQTSLRIRAVSSEHSLLAETKF